MAVLHIVGSFAFSISCSAEDTDNTINNKINSNDIVEKLRHYQNKYTCPKGWKGLLGYM